MHRFKLAIFSALFVGGGLLMVPQIQAQTVFLPSFRNFSYRGAVSVPDGGRITLGGVNSSSEGSVSNGVPGLSNVPGLGRGFKNRAIGREQNAGGLSATAEIIIMEELEAEHLAKAGIVPGQQAENADVLRKAAFLTKNMGRRAKDD